jgi:hypothetical protein
VKWRKLHEWNRHLHSPIHILFCWGDLRTSSTRGGQHTLRLIYLTKQKPKADNMDCISRGKKENGRFVAKGDLNFLAAEYFPTRHMRGGVAFEVPAMSLGQLCQ